MNAKREIRIKTRITKRQSWKTTIIIMITITNNK